MTQGRRKGRVTTLLRPSLAAWAFAGAADGDKPPFFFDSQKVCKICSAFSALEGQAGEYCRFVPVKKVCKITERIKVSEQQKSNQRFIGH